MDAIDQGLKAQVDGLVAQMRASTSQARRAELLRQCTELLAKRRAIAARIPGRRRDRDALREGERR